MCLLLHWGERENLNLIPSSGFGFLEILSFELFSLQPKYKVRGKEWLHFFLFLVCTLLYTVPRVCLVVSSSQCVRTYNSRYFGKQWCVTPAAKKSEEE